MTTVIDNKIDINSILVVDDEKYICDLCYDSLSHAGYKVETTSNPKTAIKKLSQNHFDLVLTDIKMPQINGLELVKQLRLKFPDIPVVIMTGYPTVESAIEALNEGANCYVCKPFNLEELVLTVRRTIENRQLMRENIRLQTQVNFFKLSEKINSLHDPVDINRLLLDAAISETGAFRGAIFGVEPETEQVYLSYGVNLDGLIEHDTIIDHHAGLPGYILKLKTPLIIESWKDEMENIISIGEEKWSKYAIGIPLQYNDSINGVLSLYKNDSPLTMADVDGAVILAIQASIALRNAELVLDVENLFLETIKSLAVTLDERDPYTHGHSKRVGQIAVEIGKVMKLSERQLKELELAGHLHDIGKIGIRDSILLKRGRLTEKEHQIIQAHTEKGYNILKNIKRLSSVVEAVYTHHEWYNGQGYPRGLKSNEIPLTGAIIAVADAFDTIVTDRLYRKRRRYAEGIKVVEEKSGMQFDVKVVKALRQVNIKDLPL